MNTVIELKHVNFSYGQASILKDVSFKLFETDFISIIGPNGGGKTTLLKLILGLLEPLSGTVHVLGQPALHSRSYIGYVPQYCRFDPKFPVRVIDVVGMALLGQGIVWGRYSKSQMTCICDALEKVCLQDHLYRPMAVLSGGQQQRVLISRALAVNPKILLLDEPTANLDPEMGSKFYDLLSSFKGQYTMAIVSHDVSYVASIVDRVFCIQNSVVEHPIEKKQEAIHGQRMHRICHETCME